MTLLKASESMRTRSLVTALAFLTSGTVLGVATQQIASADVSGGDRPVLIQITPCRLADTRPAPQTVGPRSVPLGTADTHTIDVQQAGTDCAGKIPADASAVALNITALGATQQSFLTIWAGGDRPDASSLNPSPGEPPTPNAATTELSVDQDFKIYNDAGNVNIVVDITGFYVNHDHDDRYYTETEVDARLSNVTGLNVADRSLTLSDLGGPGSGNDQTTTVVTAIGIPAGSCRSQLTGNFGEGVIGKLVVGTLADSNGDPVLPNTAAFVPSVVIGTTQGGAVPNLVVCNTGSSALTIPVGSVFTWRMIDG
jgi:hypothetical protein